jgi:hypothetical protein
MRVNLIDLDGYSYQMTFTRAQLAREHGINLTHPREHQFPVSGVSPGLNQLGKLMKDVSKPSTGAGAVDTKTQKVCILVEHTES